MAEETKTDEVVGEVAEEFKEMSPEDKAEAWERWVAGEVNAALGLYLPISVEGNIGVQYRYHIAGQDEQGEIVDQSKADGVTIFVDFKFEKTIDLTKPMVEEETESEEE
jgi:hypothetical protein